MSHLSPTNRKAETKNDIKANIDANIVLIAEKMWSSLVELSNVRHIDSDWIVVALAKRLHLTPKKEPWFESHYQLKKLCQITLHRRGK